jgi:NTP pyrophosphatase (non-canonical NTP hydrolase)
MGGFGGESRARRKLMRRNKREVGTIRKNQWFFVILSLIVVGTLMTGCSKTTGSSAEKEEKRGQPYIMGEVVEVANATPTEKKKGVMGTIDIEGSRSQEIGEALITVTNKTKIIDERGGNPSPTFEAIKEAWFDVLSSAPNPWYATASKLVICP